MLKIHGREKIEISVTIALILIERKTLPLHRDTKAVDITAPGDKAKIIKNILILLSRSNIKFKKIKKTMGTISNCKIIDTAKALSIINMLFTKSL